MPQLISFFKAETGAKLDLDWLESDEIHLAYIERGSIVGSAGKAITLLIRYADEHNLKITLTALHNAPNLIRYYEKLGFVPSQFDDDQDFNNWMSNHEQNWSLDDNIDENGISMTRNPTI